MPALGLGLGLGLGAAQRRASVITPRSFPNLALWLASDVGVYKDAGTTPAGNGDTAEQWNDQSGNGNNETQSSAGSRMLFSTNSINGLPSLASDGSKYLNASYVGAIGTILMVVRQRSTGEFTDVSGGNNSNGQATGAYYLQLTNADLFSYTLALSTDTNLASLHCQSQPALNAWGVLGGVQDGTTATLFKSGVACGNNAAITNTLATTTEAYTGAGFYNGSVTDFGNWDIAEKIIYSTALSFSQLRQLVQEYLLPRYALNLTNAKYYWTGFEASNASQFLYTLISADSINWKYTASDYIQPSGDVVRDVSCTVIDGTYWIAHSATDGTGPSTYFDIASSPNGQNYTSVLRVDCSSIAIGAGAATWAPEWFVDTDGSVHIVVALSIARNTDSGFQIYELHPTNSDFTAWSLPVLITGTSLATNMIDPQIVKVGGVYNLWYKNETTKFIEYASSASLLTGYTVTQNGDWAGWGGPLEGASLLKTGTSEWTIYLDAQGAGYYYSKSTDNWATWSAKTLVTSSVPMQHGTAISLPSAPPINTVAPVLTSSGNINNPIVLDVLSVTNGTWTGDSPISYSYEWFNTVTGQVATSTTYTVQASDIGAKIFCKILAVNPAGGGVARSNQSGTVI